MADRLILWRMMTKTLARKYGCEATFMPKPYADRTGSGGHYNMSLADLSTGENLFADPDDPRGCGVSTLTYQFIAGDPPPRAGDLRDHRLYRQLV